MVADLIETLLDLADDPSGRRETETTEALREAADALLKAQVRETNLRDEYQQYAARAAR